MVCIVVPSVSDHMPIIPTVTLTQLYSMIRQFMGLIREFSYCDNVAVR